MQCPRCSSIILCFYYHSSGRAETGYWICDKCGSLFCDWQQAQISNLEKRIELFKVEFAAVDKANQELNDKNKLLQMAVDCGTHVGAKHATEALMQFAKHKERLEGELQSVHDLYREKVAELQRQLKTTKLKWQTGKPKYAGYYWMYDSNSLHQTIATWDGRIFSRNGFGIMSEKWSGPIPEPEE
jgi:hypothetical protein